MLGNNIAICYISLVPSRNIIFCLVEVESLSIQDRWVLCNCLKDLLSEEDSLDALENDRFRTCSCNDKFKISRRLEVRNVLKLVRRANDIQAGATEESNWVAHSISLLQLVIGERGEIYPLRVDSVENSALE
ncbi:uncharacterized protein DFL_007637 [Arthrobotrys flagrans]|uniref:Uncharacterized protein n=1 Tax=Arthrobotrys flagrans TaxID=97331 RepID=A0A436ZW78_ARTFL|nr:hypothetical protein DFL_007637 [Arthrobotrys flagrans]